MIVMAGQRLFAGIASKQQESLYVRFHKAQFSFMLDFTAHVSI
jgi:hypothetical protein